MKKHINIFFIFAVSFLSLFIFSIQNVEAATFDGVCLSDNNFVTFDKNQSECNAEFEYTWIDNFEILKEEANTLCFEAIKNTTGSNTFELDYRLVNCTMGDLYIESSGEIFLSGLQSCPDDYCFEKSTTPNLGKNSKLLLNFQTLNLDITPESCFYQEKLSDCHDTSKHLNTTHHRISANAPCIDVNGNELACPFSDGTFISPDPRIYEDPDTQKYLLYSANWYSFNISNYEFELIESTEKMHEPDVVDFIIMSKEFFEDAIFYIWMILGALLTIRGAILGAQIIKLAESSEERAQKIKSLGFFFFGVFSIGIIVTLMPVLLNLLLSILQ